MDNTTETAAMLEGRAYEQLANAIYILKQGQRAMRGRSADWETGYCLARGAAAAQAALDYYEAAEANRAHR